VVPSMHLGSVWLVGVKVWFWAPANWAAVTPTKAAAQRATATIARISFVFICFFLAYLIWLGVVWRLADTVVKRFFETLLCLKSGVFVGNA
jgi:hypothetical protein